MKSDGNSISRAVDPAKNTSSLLSGAGSSSHQGALAAFFAFVLWGILPVFWKGLASVDSLEILCHRILWSFVAVAPFMLFRGRLGLLAGLMRSRRTFFGLLFCGFLLAGNWFLYIWAITSDKVVEASLGYYITPLVNILFGVVFFREKTSALVKLAVGLAAVGVLYRMLALGALPYVPLGLAFSFGLYGLLRKILVVEALPGLFVETLAVLPLALGYLVRQASLGNSAFFRGDYVIDALLVCAGLITAVPLLCFAYGARRIRLTTLGILQYLTPTCVLLLGVLVYDEAFTLSALICFVLIWSALALYTWDTLLRRRR